MSMRSTEVLTVGEWRRVFAYLPDDTPVVLKAGNDFENLAVQFDELNLTPGGDPSLGPVFGTTHVSLVVSIIDLEEQDEVEDDDA